MRVTNLRPTLGATLDRQHDVLSRGQLLAAGVDDMTIHRYARMGRWLRLLPGIYLVEPTVVGTEHKRIAVALYAGEQAQLTGLTVLHWYGFRYAAATDKIHVLVPHTTRRRSTGFAVVQRALALDPAARDGGLYWVTSPARAVVDACRMLTQLRDVRAIVAEAVHSAHTSATSIDAEIRRAVRSRTGLVRRALTEVTGGIRSAPEAELLDLTARSSVLSGMLWNPTLTTLDGRPLPTPDGWIPEVGIALEVDSAEHHSDSGDGWRRTLERHNELSKYGVEVLHFTPSEIRAFPRRVLTTIEEAYRSRLASTARALVITVDVKKGTFLDAQR
ncbi:MAG TPA: type IV toxin-antitoxin system AbiEi family antitoxin domain-containing protein [Micromonosporaceae bacterium]|jgi:hypothetical protein